MSEAGTALLDPDTADSPVATRPLICELAEWRLLLPFAGRVTALQGAHPTIAKGIYDHSTAFTDPVGRLSGVRAQDTPADVEGPHASIRDGIETNLPHRPALTIAALLHSVPLPARMPIPAWLWKALGHAVSHPAQVLILGSFPSTIR